MGLDRNTREPCGFAFVEFFSRSAAVNAVSYLNKSKLDDQEVRVEVDRGHLDQEPDRKFGRSRSGGQVRDEINRDRGIINLRRLNQADAALVSPRLQLRQPGLEAGQDAKQEADDTGSLGSARADTGAAATESVA